jgi:hypothetical protein
MYVHMMLWFSVTQAKIIEFHGISKNNANNSSSIFPDARCEEVPVLGMDVYWGACIGGTGNMLVPRSP